MAGGWDHVRKGPSNAALAPADTGRVHQGSPLEGAAIAFDAQRRGGF